MPCIRRNETTETKKKLSLGERFAIALELEKKPQVFEAVKGRLRRKALEIFNLKLPIFQQQEKMAEFVKQAIDAFPGFFSEDHENNKQRLHLLEQYGADYLNKSGKMTIPDSEKQSKTRKADKISAALTVTTAPPAIEHTIKGERPKPTPLHRGASRISDSSNTSIKSTNGVVTSTPKSTSVHKAGAGNGGGGSVQPSAMKKSSDIPRLDIPVFKLREDGPLKEGASPSLPPVVSKVVSKKPKPATVSTIQPPSQIVKKSSSADSNPNISFAPLVTPSPPSTPIAKAPAVVKNNTLTIFLASCLPSMVHRAAAFEAAGVTTAAGIAGMAQWPEEALRTFIEKQNLGQNPLEVQAILLGMLSNVSYSLSFP